MRRVAAVLVLVLASAGCGADVATPSAGGASASTRAVAPTPEVSASGTPGLGWRRISVVEKAPDVMGDWRTLGGSAFGYAALASSPAAVWFSSDGVSWSKTRLRVPEGTALRAEAVAGSTDAILVAGEYTPCSQRAYGRNPFGDCRPRPVSWVSSDGRSWKPSPAWNGPIGEPGRSGSQFNEVWAVPTGGWDAAQAFDPSDESDDAEPQRPAIWHSSDGLAWERLKAEAPEGADCRTDLTAGELRAGADSAGRRLAAGIEEDCGAQVWASADGQVWMPVAAFSEFSDQSLTAVVGVVLPGSRDRPWRLLGWLENTNGDSLGAVVWRSTDLVTWTMDPLSADEAPGGIVLAGTQATGLDVAVGRSLGANVTWSSKDGVAWQLVEGASAPIEAVASGPAGVLGLIGTWDAAGDTVTGFEVWQLASEPPR